MADPPTILGDYMGCDSDHRAGLSTVSFIIYPLSNQNISLN